MYYEQFQRKTWGRIFVWTVAHRTEVRAIIRELDEFEHSYMPNDFIALFSEEEHSLVYGHKFELDMQLIRQVCFQKAIPVMLITGCKENEIWLKEEPTNDES